jgi:TPR repeat protein
MYAEILNMQEHPEASARLGFLYAHGKGVPRNAQKALQLLQAGVNGGSSYACCELGVMLQGGIDVQRNDSRSLELLQQAHAAGNRKATSALGSMYMRGHGVKLNQRRAFEYFNQAFTSGEKIPQDAANLMGAMYIHGQGVKEDTPRGLKLLEIAHAEGNPSASLCLGEFQRTKRRDFRKAGLYYDFAHWSGYSRGEPCIVATYQLALLYFAGMGVHRDVGKGLYFLLIARDAEYPEAIKIVDTEVWPSVVASNPELTIAQATEAAKFFFVPVGVLGMPAPEMRRKYSLDWKCAAAGLPLPSGRTYDAIMPAPRAGFCEEIGQEEGNWTINVHILEFSRHPQTLRRALLEGEQLRQCREGLLHSGLSPEMPSGAKVFVAPMHFEDVMRALQTMGLKPWHVAASDDFVNQVVATAQSLPSREQVREKSRQSIQVMASCEVCGVETARFACSRCGQARYCSQGCQQKDWQKHQRICARSSSDYGFDPGCPVTIKHTFIHVDVENSMRSDVDYDALLTASSTDACPRKGLNPRKQLLAL